MYSPKFCVIEKICKGYDGDRCVQNAKGLREVGASYVPVFIAQFVIVIVTKCNSQTKKNNFCFVDRAFQ